MISNLRIAALVAGAVSAAALACAPIAAATGDDPFLDATRYPQRHFARVGFSGLTAALASRNRVPEV